MRPYLKGVAVAAVHCGIVLSLAGKYAWDREHLPRVWAMAIPGDPNLPLRGRYVGLRLRVESEGRLMNWTPVRLSVQNNRLTATPSAEAGSEVHASNLGGQGSTLTELVAFFIPEHVEDPSRRLRDEELWVEVSVPERSMPRPIRLAVKKDGVLTPLPLR